MCDNVRSTSKYIQPPYNPSIVHIPHTLPVIEGLQRSVYSLSLESIRYLRTLFRSADVDHSGLLRRNSILRCLAEVIPNAAYPDSPWRRFFESISESHQLIPYGDLIKLINAEKHGDRGAGPSIEEILSLQKSDRLRASGESLRRVQSEKMLFDRSYAKLIIDLELAISKSPDKVDIDRLKMATQQSVITVKEFIDIVSIYGFEKLLEPIIGRIITAFQDAQGKFNYSDFVRCLDRVQPSILLSASANSAPLPLPPSLASERVPLGPILSAEREQSDVSQWNEKEWEEFYMKEGDEE